ncbi:MAG: NAD(P)H-binding protein [Actinomycetota bacterium]
MKVVVAGGTGFLGRHISRALMDGGHEVTVLGRDPNKVSRIPQLAGAIATRGDVTDPASLRGTLEGADGVVVAVQLPNYPIEQRRKGLTFDRFDRGGTENLLAEARRSGVQNFVYLSGAGVHPESDKPWYRAKGRAEVAIRKSGITHTILRPSWAYGPEDKALNKFVFFARVSPIVPKPGVKTQRVQPVYSGDIALAVQRIFERSDAWGRTLEIGGPLMTMTEIVHTMLEVMGKKRLVVPVPAPLLKVATAPLLILPTPPMSPGGIDFAVQEGVVDTTEMERVLGVHPIGFREGISRYLGR